MYRQPTCVYLFRFEFNINDTSYTVKNSSHECMIISSRGRDKYNPNDRTTGNKNLEQLFEPNIEGESNSLTSIQKDNYVMKTITQAFGRSGHSKEENRSRKKVFETIGQLRRLTPIECERLQGFPDDWTLVKLPNGKLMSDTQRYKMMGNAVTVNVIRDITKNLSDYL